jgi:DtxR family Mn-dependent transcriptional regulator
VISEEFEDRIDAMLGHPTTDPHGHPIPPKTGRMPDEEHRRLSEVEPGEVVVVRRVHDRDGGALRALSLLELFPGVELRVVDRPPGGPITVERDGERVRVERELARTVFVG